MGTAKQRSKCSKISWRSTHSTPVTITTKKKLTENMRRYLPNTCIKTNHQTDKNNHNILIVLSFNHLSCRSSYDNNQISYFTSSAGSGRKTGSHRASWWWMTRCLLYRTRDRHETAETSCEETGCWYCNDLSSYGQNWLPVGFPPAVVVATIPLAPARSAETYRSPQGGGGFLLCRFSPNHFTM
jgi:hypothetical protein